MQLSNFFFIAFKLWHNNNKLYSRLHIKVKVPYKNTWHLFCHVFMSENGAAFPAHTACLFSHWPNCRWTPMMCEWERTWERLCWWKLRRRSTGCMMTGTAGTSQSRPHLGTTWNFPASVGLWTTRKWCCEMEEVGASVVYLSFYLFIFFPLVLSAMTQVTSSAPPLTLSRVYFSLSASGWQDQPGQASQTKRAWAEEKNLQASSLCTGILWLCMWHKAEAAH